MFIRCLLFPEEQGRRHRIDRQQHFHRSLVAECKLIEWSPHLGVWWQSVLTGVWQSRVDMRGHPVYLWCKHDPKGHPHRPLAWAWHRRLFLALPRWGRVRCWPLAWAWLGRLPLLPMVWVLFRKLTNFQDWVSLANQVFSPLACSAREWRQHEPQPLTLLRLRAIFSK